jgi:hypothetical protein
VPSVLPLGVPELRVMAPESIAGSYGIQAAQFGAPLSPVRVSGPVVHADDGAGTASDACERLRSGVTGAIVVIDRGMCAFVVKVHNAQDAGAVGALIVNNVPGAPPPPLLGVDASMRPLGDADPGRR